MYYCVVFVFLTIYKNCLAYLHHARLLASPVASYCGSRRPVSKRYLSKMLLFNLSKLIPIVYFIVNDLIDAQTLKYGIWTESKGSRPKAEISIIFK